MPNITNITPPRVPLTDARTGMISREWYRFFLNLFVLTGSGQSDLTIDDLAVAPNSMTAEAFAQINDLYNAALTYPSSGEIEAAIDRLRNEVETAPRNELGTMAAIQQDNVPWLRFNNAPSPAPSTTTTGTMYWDGGITARIVMTPYVVQPIGEAQYYYAKNVDPAAGGVKRGQLMMFAGAVGSSNQLQAKLANSTDLTSGDYLMGIAAEDIAKNGFGLITSFGAVASLGSQKIDTSAWPLGTILYYDPATPGGLTSTLPSAPNVKATVAAVTESSTSGAIFVRVTFGSKLGQTDSNVQFGTLADKNIIQYDSALGYWKNVAPSTVVVGTATNLAGGAAGSVPYQSAPDTTTFLSIGAAKTVMYSTGTAPAWASQLYWDAANARLGIAVASPAYTLHLSTNSANGDGIYGENVESASYFTLRSMGSTGFGVGNWPYSVVLEGVPQSTGNLVISSYTNSIIFTTSTGRTNRMSISDTGLVTIAGATTLSTATGAIALGTSQTTGTWTAGGASQTGTLTLDQSTKTHTLNIGTGATENAATKTINLGTGGVAGSTTNITVGSGIGANSYNATTHTLRIGGTAAATLAASSFNLASGYTYQINGANVLSATTLGSGVTVSSLTSVGTLTALAITGNVDVSDNFAGERFINVTNNNTGASSIASYRLTGQGNNFYLRNYGDGTTTPNRTDFLSSAGGSYFTFSPSNTESFRMGQSGNVYSEIGAFWQYAPAPTAKTSSVTLTAAELKTGIITSNGSSLTLTLPTGTAIDSGFPDVPTTDIGFDVYFMNLNATALTIAVNTNVTNGGIAANLTVAASTSGHFRLRRTAANTYVLYRIS